MFGGIREAIEPDRRPGLVAVRSHFVWQFPLRFKDGVIIEKVLISLRVLEIAVIVEV